MSPHVPRPHRDEPVSLALQEDHSSQMDRYLVYGDKYKSLRDAVGKAVLECKPLAIAAAVKVGRPLPPPFPSVPNGAPEPSRVSTASARPAETGGC